MPDTGYDLDELIGMTPSLSAPAITPEFRGLPTSPGSRGTVTFTPAQQERASQFGMVPGQRGGLNVQVQGQTTPLPQQPEPLPLPQPPIQKPEEFDLDTILGITKPVAMPQPVQLIQPTAQPELSPPKSTPNELPSATGAAAKEAGRGLGRGILATGAGLAGMLRGGTQLLNKPFVWAEKAADHLREKLGKDPLPPSFFVELDKSLNEPSKAEQYVAEQNQKSFEDTLAGAGVGAGMAQEIAQNVFGNFFQTAMTLGLAGAGKAKKAAEVVKGIPGFAKASWQSLKLAFPEAAKFAAFTAATTPGTTAERAKAGAESAAMIVLPAVTAGFPTSLTAKAASFAVLSGLTTVPGLPAAYEQAQGMAQKNGGTPEQWLAVTLTPGIIMNLLFSASAKSMPAEARQQMLTEVRAANPELVKKYEEYFNAQPEGLTEGQIARNLKKAGAQDVFNEAVKARGGGSTSRGLTLPEPAKSPLETAKVGEVVSMPDGSQAVKLREPPVSPVNESAAQGVATPAKAVLNKKQAMPSAQEAAVAIELANLQAQRDGITINGKVVQKPILMKKADIERLNQLEAEAQKPVAQGVATPAPELVKAVTERPVVKTPKEVLPSRERRVMVDNAETLLINRERAINQELPDVSKRAMSRDKEAIDQLVKLNEEKSSIKSQNERIEKAKQTFKDIKDELQDTTSPSERRMLESELRDAEDNLLDAIGEDMRHYVPITAEEQVKYQKYEQDQLPEAITKADQRQTLTSNEASRLKYFAGRNVEDEGYTKDGDNWIIKSAKPPAPAEKPVAEAQKPVETQPAPQEPAKGEGKAGEPAQPISKAEKLNAKMGKKPKTRAPLSDKTTQENPIKALARELGGIRPDKGRTYEDQPIAITYRGQGDSVDGLHIEAINRGIISPNTTVDEMLTMLNAKPKREMTQAQYNKQQQERPPTEMLEVEAPNGTLVIKGDKIYKRKGNELIDGVAKPIEHFEMIKGDAIIEPGHSDYKTVAKMYADQQTKEKNQAKVEAKSPEIKLEQQTPQDLLKEREATTKAAKKKQMMEKANAPLKGKSSDISTGDMFERTSLFQPPTPTPKAKAEVKAESKPKLLSIPEAANAGMLVAPTGHGIPRLRIEFTTTDGKVNSVKAEDADTLKGAGPYKKVRLVDAKGNVVDKYKLGVKSSEQAIRSAGEGALTGQPPPLPSGAPVMSGTPSEFKMYEKTRELMNKYVSGNIGERQGVRQGTLGTYYRNTGNAFVHAMNNIWVATHETVHAVESQTHILDKLTKVAKLSKSGNPVYDSSTKLERKQLTQIYLDYYAGAKKDHPLRLRMVEGVATFLSKYVEKPIEVQEKYPELVKMFLHPSGKYYNEKIADLTKDAQDIVNEYRGLDDWGKVGSRITRDVQTIDDKRIMSFMDRQVEASLDRHFGLVTLEKKAGSTEAVASPATWARNIRRSMYRAARNITQHRIAGVGKKTEAFWGMDENGNWTKQLDHNWYTLIDKVAKDGNESKFDSYLVARREHFAFEKLDALKKSVQSLKEQVAAEKEEGTVSKETMEALNSAVKEYDTLKGILDRDNFDRDIVDRVYAEGEKLFAEESKMYDEFNAQTLDILSHPLAGILSKEDAAAMKDDPGYATFMRTWMNELTQSGEENIKLGKSTFNRTLASETASVLKRRKGGEQTIVSPVYGAISGYLEAARKAQHQIVKNKVADLADKYPDLLPLQKMKLVTQFDPDTGKTMYPQDGAKNILMGMRDGKRTPYLVSKELADIVETSLSPEALNVADKIMSTGARIFVKGTTGLYPGWILINPTVDQFTAVAQTKNKYIPVLSQLRQIAGIMRNKSGREAQYWNEYLEIASGSQTLTHMADLTPEEFQAWVLNERKGIEKFADYVDSVENVIGFLPTTSELMTRGTEYVNARMAGKHQIEAFDNAATVTGSFEYKGKARTPFGATWARGMPYFNAAKQVLRQAYLAAKTPGRRGRFFGVMALMAGIKLAELAAMALVASKRQREDYLQLSPSELAMNIFIPHKNGKDWIRIRAPKQLLVLSTMLNMMISNQMKEQEDPYDMADFAEAATAWLPDQWNVADPVRLLFSWIPQIMRPGIEAAFGKKTWPRVRDIEAGMEYKPSEERYYETTSRLGKELGKTELAKMFDISPLKIDHLILGYGGRVYGPIIGVPNTTEKMLNPFKRQVFLTSGRTFAAYYDVRQRIMSLHADMNKNRKSLTKAEEVYVNDLYSHITEANKALIEYRKMKDVDTTEGNKLRSILLHEVMYVVGSIEHQPIPRGISEEPKSQMTQQDAGGLRRPSRSRGLRRRY